MATRRNQRLLMALTLCFTAAATPWAVADTNGQDRGARRGPPQEAFSACASQTEQAQCSFNGRRGETVSGSCLVPRSGDSGLVCVPADGPPRHDQERASSTSNS